MYPFAYTAQMKVSIVLRFQICDFLQEQMSDQKDHQAHFRLARLFSDQKDQPVLAPVAGCHLWSHEAYTENIGCRRDMMKHS